MKMKRFQAKDMRTALKMVRDTLGPDAVIISNKSIQDGIELVAAMDFDASIVRDVPISTETQQKPTAVAELNISSQHALQTELSEIKQLLGDFFRETQWEKVQSANAVVMQTLRQLNAMGISGKICKSLQASISDTNNQDIAWQQALSALAQQIPISPVDLISQGGVMAFVGPTGVGKTTTVAKIAARFCLRQSARDLALITTDTYRIGAQDQLATYGKILDVPVFTVDSPEALQARLQRLQEKKLILIDTAGFSQRDLRMSAQFNILQQANVDIMTTLVTATTTQKAVLRDIFSQYTQAKISNVILTKLDEAANLGEVVSLIVRYQLPLLYFTAGQKVPEDIVPASTAYLINSMMDIAKQYQDENESFVDELTRGTANATP